MQVMKVLEFNEMVQKHLNVMGEVLVEGEITEMSITQKKGVYLTLSDKQANLRTSGYFYTIDGINLVQKGMSIIATGVPDLYKPSGSFSLKLKKVEPVGEGALQVAYEKLKKQLYSEGLFDSKYKRPLPNLVTKIALISGKDSAAYSDFIKILKENDQNIEVNFFPALVQGQNAVEDILKKIKSISAPTKEYDIVVLTRGGGSLEDLKSFNNEQIIREIFHSRQIFLVGVGHEVDESLADFVADVRASTPSQCAYYIVSINNTFKENLDASLEKISQKIKERINNYVTELNYAKRKVLDSIQNKLENVNNDIIMKEKLLKSYNVNSILKRGFAIIEAGEDNPENKKHLGKTQNVKYRKRNLVKSKQGLAYKSKLKINFYDGSVNIEVIDKNLLLENPNSSNLASISGSSSPSGHSSKADNPSAKKNSLFG